MDNLVKFTVCIMCFVIAGVAAFAMCASILAIYRKKSLRYRIKRGEGIVIKKEFDDRFITQIVTKTFPMGLFNEYNVHILFRGKTYCFNDEELFKKVKVGDHVSILIHHGYDKQWNLKDTYLSVEY